MIKWEDVIDETLLSQWKLFLDEFIIVKKQKAKCTDNRASATADIYDFLNEHNIDLTELVYIESNEDYGCCWLLKIAVRELAPAYVIQVMLDADTHGITVCDREVMQNLMELYTPSQEWVDSHMAKPLLYTMLDFTPPPPPSTPQAKIAKKSVQLVVEEGRTLDEEIEEYEENGTSDSHSLDINNNSNNIVVESTTKHSELIEKSKSVYEKPIIGLRIPKGFHPYIAQSIAKDPQLRDLVNRKTTDRVVFVPFIADLVFNVAMIVTYCLAVNSLLMNMRNVQAGHKQEVVPVSADLKYCIFLLVTLLYFIIRQTVKIWSTFRKEYHMIDSLFLLFEWTKIGMVLTALILMWVDTDVTDDGHYQCSGYNGTDPCGGSEDDCVQCGGLWNLEYLEDPEGYPKKTFLVVASLFVFLGLILFLRTAFLPFSLFVNGSLNIVRELIPFLVVTCIILCAFAFMYYVERFDDGVDNDGKCDNSDNGNFCTYETAFYNVFGYLSSGPDETSDWLDILTGIVVVIIFLNVVIAIVTNVWDGTEETVSVYFWQQRLYYLAGLNKFSSLTRRLAHLSRQSWLGKCVQKIEKVGSKRVFDRVAWGIAPYSYITDKESYKSPFKNALVQEKLSKASREVKVKWSTQLGNLKSYEADMKFSDGFGDKMRVVYDFVVNYFFWYIFFLALGFVTFGWTWPLHIREALNIVTPSDQQTDGGGDGKYYKEKYLQYKDLQKENEELRSQIEALHRQNHYLVIQSSQQANNRGGYHNHRRARGRMAFSA